MPNVIDSFIIEFGLDSKNFTESQRKALDDLSNFQDKAVRAGNDLERSQRRMMDMLTGFKREAITLIGAMFGAHGIKEFVTNLTSLDAATGRVAKTMNMSVRDVSAWRGAVEQMGGAGDSIVSTLQAMTQDMYRFKITGQSTLADMLRPFGIGVFDANRQLKDTGDLLLEISEAMDRQHMGAADKAAYLSMLPGMNQDTINLLVQGTAKIRETIELSRQAGLTTRESAAAAAEYQKQLSLVNQSAENLGRTLFMKLAPALADILTKMQAMVQELSRQADSGESWYTRFWKAGRAIAQFDASLGGNNLIGAGVGAINPFAGSGSPSGAASSPPAGGGSVNWSNFLAGLSYLETSQKGGGNSQSTAQGYFQFINGTAKRAMGMGISNPQQGTYAEQAEATRKYIQQAHPKAAAAIEAGDFDSASAMLKGEWPSLPGGIQPQNSGRYQVWRNVLQGGGPRPPGQATTTSVSVGQIVIHNPKDSAEVAQNVKGAVERVSFASHANSGLQ